MEQIIEQFFYDYFIVYIEKFWAVFSIVISLYKMIVTIANRIKEDKIYLCNDIEISPHWLSNLIEFEKFRIEKR